MVRAVQTFVKYLFVLAISLNIDPAFADQAEGGIHCAFPPNNNWKEFLLKSDARWSILRASGCFSKTAQGEIIRTSRLDGWVTHPVNCSFLLDKQGHATNVRVEKPSGDSSSDQTAVDLIRKAGPYLLGSQPKVLANFTETNLRIECIHR